MSRQFVRLSMLLLVILLFNQCEKNPVIDHDIMLDGDIIFDASLYDKESYLVSYALPAPTPAQLATPVIIAAHGYTASTFEWDEFREWAEPDQPVLISQVLLGGHGRDYETFKASTWKDWRDPILDEYTRLSDMGYTNINLAGSSTGCPLILELFVSNSFSGYQSPNEVFLIDPLVVPANKLLSIIKVAGPMLGYTETETNEETQSYWYTYRPQETLQQLMELANKVRLELEDGFELSEGTRMKVYKSLRDASADPVGALMIYKGVEESDGSTIDVEIIDSDLHVFTRLDGRESVTQSDRDTQLAAFEEFILRVQE